MANSPKVSIASKVNRAASVTDTPVPVNRLFAIWFCFMVKKSGSFSLNADVKQKIPKPAKNILLYGFVNDEIIERSLFKRTFKAFMD